MISVVVPIYNEEEIVVQFHEAVSSALTGVVSAWEVVYVNDGSTDSSLELLKGLQSIDPHIVVVELSRNWGHMGAIAAGLKTAVAWAIYVFRSAAKGAGVRAGNPRHCELFSSA